MDKIKASMEFKDLAIKFIKENCLPHIELQTTHRGDSFSKILLLIDTDCNFYEFSSYDSSFNFNKSDLNQDLSLSFLYSIVEQELNSDVLNVEKKEEKIKILEDSIRSFLCDFEYSNIDNYLDTDTKEVQTVLNTVYEKIKLDLKIKNKKNINNKLKI